MVCSVIAQAAWDKGPLRGREPTGGFYGLAAQFLTV